jgi:type I restriction enzyme S subunit
MKWKPYPKYRDSDMEWLGDVPEHWTGTLLKRGFDVTLGKMLQTEAKTESDKLLPYLRAANIQWSGVDSTDVKEMWFSETERDQLSLKYGDLLVSEGGDVGRCAIWHNEVAECYFQNSVNRVRSIEGNTTLFLYYWIQAVKQAGYIDILCNKSTISHFTAEKVKALAAAFPPITEQTTIASFLDRETSKIDTLVAKQERLIELLRERRNALISHAVTKGLDPNAKMKDSGVEWLGEVPEHWEVKRLGWYFTERRDKVSDKNFAPLSVTKNGIVPQLETAVKTDDGDNRKLVRAGDFVINSRSDRKGSSGLSDMDGSVSLINIVLEPNHYIDGYFVHHVLKSYPFQEEFYRYGKGIVADLWSTNYSEMRNIPIAVPEKPDQSTIASFLDRETAKIDILIEKSRRSIELLQERRKALISAAVTGKIDVREAAA